MGARQGPLPCPALAPKPLDIGPSRDLHGRGSSPDMGPPPVTSGGHK